VSIRIGRQGQGIGDVRMAADRLQSRTGAVASTDGTKAVNILTGESVAAVKDFFDTHTGASAATEFFAADAANAVGLPK
jgi:hypothetical protein